MASFNIILTPPGSTFNIVLTGSAAPTGSGGNIWLPPVVNQIYPRFDYTTGSLLYTTSGQLWPRGTGLQAPA
jgi:hypothetical protein